MSDCKLISDVKDELISVLRELAAVKAERDVAVQELRNIINAPKANFTDEHEYIVWARSRIRHTLTALDAARGTK